MPSCMTTGFDMWLAVTNCVEEPELHVVDVEAGPAVVARDVVPRAQCGNPVKSKRPALSNNHATRPEDPARPEVVVEAELEIEGGVESVTRRKSS